MELPNEEKGEKNGWEKSINERKKQEQIGKKQMNKKVIFLICKVA